MTIKPYRQTKVIFYPKTPLPLNEGLLTEDELPPETAVFYNKEKNNKAKENKSIVVNKADSVPPEDNTFTSSKSNNNFFDSFSSLSDSLPKPNETFYKYVDTNKSSSTSSSKPPDTQPFNLDTKEDSFSLKSNPSQENDAEFTQRLNKQFDIKEPESGEAKPENTSTSSSKPPDTQPFNLDTKEDSFSLKSNPSQENDAEFIQRLNKQFDIKEPESGEAKPENTSNDNYSKDYKGVSIVEFLQQSGKPSDIEARRKLAVSMGIVNTPEEYTGTAQQNTSLLKALRSGKEYSDGVGVRKAQPVKSSTTPAGGKGPTIRYNRREYPAYIDMGGGKFRPARQEELDNPNMQLYIPNPTKGQQEYQKSNFVKVRREGSAIRPQSQFTGAAGSLSNFFGDVGNSLAKPFRK